MPCRMASATAPAVMKASPQKRRPRFRRMAADYRTSAATHHRPLGPPSQADAPLIRVHGITAAIVPPIAGRRRFRAILRLTLESLLEARGDRRRVFAAAVPGLDDHG
jgi:hypothetical protein